MKSTPKAPQKPAAKARSPRAAVKSRGLTPPSLSPKTNIAPTREPSHDDIATRAYFISISGEGGSDFENWIRAEQELRAQTH